MPSWQPQVALPLAVSAFTYAGGVARIWHRAGVGAAIRPWRAAAFATGIAALGLALLSPLDTLADALFSAHMAQHLVLIVVAPPLLLAGRPYVALPWLLPATWRRRGLGWWHHSLLDRSFRTAATPLVAVALQSAALWTWHLPGLYTAALGHEWVHGLEHLSFLATALLFWSAVLAPGGGRRHQAYPLRIVSVFLVMLQGGALGALLMFSRQAWYPVHEAGAALRGMSLLEDQQLAGLIMWVPAGVAYLAAILFLTSRWLHREDVLALRHDAVLAAAAQCSGAPARAG